MKLKVPEIPKGINRFKVDRNSTFENQSFQLSIARKIRPYFHINRISRRENTHLRGCSFECTCILSPKGWSLDVFNPGFLPKDKTKVDFQSYCLKF